MKIAIRGHKSRGKDVIQIFKDFGTEGLMDHTGSHADWIYIRDDSLHFKQLLVTAGGAVFLKEHGYHVYTLEEFEKEFPFKIGDKVKDSSDNEVGIILGFIDIDDELMYVVDFEKSGHANMPVEELKPYKEMKEKRNIKLTIDKAKEWYKKGGELKEIALQAFNERELNPLPRSWEEFATNYARMGYYISSDGKPLMCASSGKLSSPHVCPSKKSAEAHLAMIQLEQLRNCYNNNSDAWGWSYSIVKRNGIPELVRGCDHNTFLRFNNEEIATQFLKNFRDLIEKAGDLI